MIEKLDMNEENDKTKKVKDLFSGWDDSLIWSCLQGVMGNINVNGKDIVSAQAQIGDFIFFTGAVDYELLRMDNYWDKKRFGILVPRNKDWEQAIETIYKGEYKKYSRYAIKKEKDIFDVNYLKSIVRSLPKQYEMKQIDQDIYEVSKTLDYGVDWVSQYPDYQDYEKKGLGFVILKDGIPISGASSYTSYNEGIEIEIDTKEEYRRQGLALICGASLILECLKRGIYPSWDAQNMGSVYLAEKLGYHYSHDYICYEVRKSKERISKNR